MAVCPLTTFLSLISCCLKVYLKELLCDFSRKNPLTVSDHLCVWIERQGNCKTSSRKGEEEERERREAERIKAAGHRARRRRRRGGRVAPYLHPRPSESALLWLLLTAWPVLALHGTHTCTQCLANIRSIQMFSPICILFSLILWSAFIQTTRDCFTDFVSSWQSEISTY